jgi:hypothetical protein
LTKKESRLPTKEEISRVTSYLSIFSDPDFKPILEWHGGWSEEKGVNQIPFPEYDPAVTEFFKILSEEQWCDFQYKSGETKEKIGEKEFIQQASLEEIKTMLTYCTRGERFCDGYWAAMIEEGYIVAILRRLVDLSS